MTRTILTVGHSNHEPEAFLSLLRKAGVRHLVDVRSQPYSRFIPQFNLSVLRTLLGGFGIEYTHEKDLGGRPASTDMYDTAGHVLYGSLADSTPFKRAIDRLEAAATNPCVAIMCGEEDPTECHRRLLVGRVMTDHGWRVVHLRGDGRLMSEDQLADVSGGIEPSLFEGGEFSMEIHTIGFTQKSAEQFFGSLKQARIKRLIDVRLNNVSQLAAFAKRGDLEYFLRELVGADYVHEPLLAPDSDLLKEYRSGDLPWEEYEKRFFYLMESRRIESAVDWDSLLDRPVVLLCSEREPYRCHRRLVVDYLNEHGRELAAIHL